MRAFSRLLLIVIIFIYCTVQSETQEYSKNGMVVAPEPIASQVGIEILKKDGNAIDAAVAVGFALAVTYPTAGNLGGGGFIVVHLADGTDISLDFRERAPLNAFKEMYLDEDGTFNNELSLSGWTASGIPGTVDGLVKLHNSYGKLPFNELLQPAIDLAANGFSLPFWQAESFNSNRDEFVKNDAAKLIFTKQKGEFEIGDLFVQTDLANTLKLIQKYGREGFYSGRVSELIVSQSEINGGYFTKEDFESYESVFRDPLKGNYRGYEIVSMPPPSSGGICLVQSLNILENFNFTKDDWGSSNYIHQLIEVLKYVYADRSKHIGDPDYYNVPTDYLISKEYALEIAQKVGEHAVPSSEISPSKFLIDESEETTHYSVVDRWGNAVSATVTLNSSYGNKIVVEGAGFLMNNEMDDFSAKPGTPNQFGLIGSEANSILPGKRMLSSITPAIVKENDEIFLILGSPGGSKIITSVLQVVLNVIDFRMDLQTAVNVPRIHHQWLPDSLYFEEFGLANEVKTELIKKGHFIGSETVLGRIQAIMYNNKKNIYVGASDPRGFGKAIGY